MKTLRVQSSIRPEAVEVFPTKDCYMRKNIVEVEDEYGTHFEYDEVLFKSDATKEEIEADFDTWYEFGVHYGEPQPEPPTWEEKMEAQVTYTALMTDTLLESLEEE